MASIQLDFTLRTTPQCKTVHLLGSWDNYQGQLPLSQATKSKSAGNWTGTFRFTGGTMQQGQRYWYYYIMDGYHCTHDPAHQSVLEPTTQRMLNILDVPAGTKSSKTSSSRSSRRASTKDVPRGRPISVSEIKSPKPYNPVQTAHLVQGYNTATVDELTQRFGYANLDEEDSDCESDLSSAPSMTSSRSSASSSPSSVSSSSSCCTCERYGLTRSGNRVMLDCKGDLCGYTDDSDSCGSDDEEAVYRERQTRRHGVIIRS